MRTALGKKRKEVSAKKTSEIMGMAELNARARKRMLFIAVAGGILLAADFALAFSHQDIKLVEQSGKLYMIRPEENGSTGHLSLQADVSPKTGDSEEISQNMEISLQPFMTESEKEEQLRQREEGKLSMTEPERIAYELRNIESGFNSDRTLRAVELPAALDTGEEISWKIRRHNNSAAILMAVFMMMIVVYKTRLDPLKKQRQREEESIVRQLPEFVNRLVLLLNAGLVLNSAFEKSIEESRRFQNDDHDYFYSRMQDIYDAVKETNSSMHLEFRKFAKESGTRELMRISNIISDNIQKGVELTEKLQRESEILWISRKKRCEEKGRMADTALTLPLVIFLMVLVVISVAPALLEL